MSDLSVSMISNKHTGFLFRLATWLADRDPATRAVIESITGDTNADNVLLIAHLQSRFLWSPPGEPAALRAEFPAGTSDGTQAEELALAFEQLLSSQFVQQKGAVYTPIPLVDHLIDRVTTYRALSDRPAILDPSCGSGIFLIRIVRAMTEANLSDIATRIHAVDIHEPSLRLAQLLVVGTLFDRLESQVDFFSLWQSLTPRFVHGNFLISQQDVALYSPRETTAVVARPSRFPHDRSFDLIIGNPPYGLSRNEQLSPLENKILLEKFSGRRTGKVNKYLLFMAQSAELLAPGGVLSFVVPNAWTGIQAGSALRADWIRKGFLQEVTHFKKRLFPAAGVEAITFVGKREEPAAKPILLRYTLSPSENSQCVTSSITPAAITRFHAGRIPLHWDTSASSILRRIREESTVLGAANSYFKPAIALQAYARGKGVPPQSTETVKKHPFHHCSKVNEHCIPYLEGRDISRYGLRWSGSYLEYGPWLAEPQERSRFEGPRLIIREVLGEYPHVLRATFTAQPYLYNKSCLHILAREAATDTLPFLALLGILNSRLAAYILHLTGRKSQRTLFPKIVNADLSDFPLPHGFLNNCQELAHLVERRLKTPSATDRLEEQIFAAACRLYGLSTEAVDHIRAFESPLDSVNLAPS